MVTTPLQLEPSGVVTILAVGAYVTWTPVTPERRYHFHAEASAAGGVVLGVAHPAGAQLPDVLDKIIDVTLRQHEKEKADRIGERHTPVLYTGVQLCMYFVGRMCLTQR